MIRYRLIFGTGILFTLLFLSCMPDEKEMATGNLVVRLSAEPERINPILGADGAGAQIENIVFQALYNFDPYTLEYIPQLAVGPPELEMFERDGKQYKKFRYTIKEAAVWPDGKPVDAGDYLFTMKAIFNPEVGVGSLRGYFGSVSNVRIHPNNRKQVEIITEGNYMLDEYVVSNLQILPRHIYDPDDLLTMISIEDLLDPDTAAAMVKRNPALSEFAAAFNSNTYSRDVVVGSGPYQLDYWETGQEVVLTRKQDWWGDEYRDSSTYFKAHPATITYRVIPDESVALNGLRDETIDVLAEISPDQFINVREEPSIDRRYNFYTPALLQYFFIPMNNQDAILRDDKVRRALSYCMDIDFVIDEILEGLATPVVGPINPEKSYYNHDLEPITLDLDKARKLLREAGWEDSNENGIRDKIIDGNRVELILEMVVSGALGQQLGLVLQEQADKVGFKIELATKKFSLIREDMWQKKYDLSALRNRQSPSPTDLYQSWHTDNMGINGSNYMGYGNAVTDSIIEVIRTTADDAERIENYRIIQRMIYEDQPVIFLAAPQARVIVSKEWESEPVKLKPGYYEPGMRYQNE